MSTVSYQSGLCLVEKFHLTFGHKVRATPSMDEPERLLRINLIREELDELFEAAEEEDFKEIIDALADIVYVAYGAALVHGLAIEHALTLKLELSLNPATGTPTYLSLGQEIKKSSTGVVLNENVYSHAAGRAEQIQTQLERFTKAGEENNSEAATVALADIVFLCFQTSWEINVDLDHILQEVQSSNMSKLGADGRPIYREDGKILKGPNFFEPDIRRCLREQGRMNNQNELI